MQVPVQVIAPPEPAPPPKIAPPVFSESTLAKSAANVDAHIIADAPVADIVDIADVAEPPASMQYIPPPAVATLATPAPEPEIAFSKVEKPQKSKPEVKTVKVKSIDVMAELEALRKRATQSSPPKPAKKGLSVEELVPRPRRDIHRNLNVQIAPDVLPRTKAVRVTVSFEDADTGVIQKQDQFVDLGDTSDVQSLSLNLKIDLA